LSRAWRPDLRKPQETRRRGISKRALLLAAALATLAVGPAQAWDTPEVELERYSTLSLDDPTPHTAWARPYAQGPLHGYYFVHSRSEGMQPHAREAIELMQRLDLKLDVSYFYRYY
jgi:hypothetical protein